MKFSKKLAYMHLCHMNQLPVNLEEDVQLIQIMVKTSLKSLIREEVTKRKCVEPLLLSTATGGFMAWVVYRLGEHLRLPGPMRPHLQVMELLYLELATYVRKNPKEAREENGLEFDRDGNLYLHV